MIEYGDRANSIVDILNQVELLLHGGRGGGHRLPDEPVQHRRRRSVPAAAMVAAAAAARLLMPWPPPRRTVSRRRDAASAPSGRGSPACSRSPAGSARSSRPSCSTRSRPARCLPDQQRGWACSRRAGTSSTPRPIAGVLVGARHPADPRCTQRRLRASSSSPWSSASATGASSTAPGSASTCAPPGPPRRPRWPAVSTSTGWCSPRCSLSGGVAGLVGMPHAARRNPPLQPRLPGRHRLHRHRHRAARPQPPVGIAFGALLWSFLDRSQQILDLESSPEGDRGHHAGHHRVVGRGRLRAGPQTAGRGLSSAGLARPSARRRRTTRPRSAQAHYRAGAPHEHRAGRPSGHWPANGAPELRCGDRPLADPDRDRPRFILLSIVRSITGADDLTSVGTMRERPAAGRSRSGWPGLAASGLSVPVSSTSASRA